MNSSKKVQPRCQKKLDDLLADLKDLYDRSSAYTSENGSTREEAEQLAQSEYFTFNSNANKSKCDSLRQIEKAEHNKDIARFFSLNDKYKSNDKMKKLENCIKKSKVDSKLQKKISDKLNKL